MFLRKLRQLKVTWLNSQVRLEYRCKQCNNNSVVYLTGYEYENLREGLPFSASFSGERKKELIHFSKGLCSNEH